MIALAEVLWGLRKKQAEDTWPTLVAALENDRRVTLYPITLEVLATMSFGLEMHDSMICATAKLVEDATGDDVSVVIKDQAIIASGLVRAIW